MAEIKTQPTQQSASAYLKTIEPEEKQKDALSLLRIFTKSTGKKPVMWGPSIVGFGSYEYQSGRKTVQWPLVGFSPRKQYFALYILAWKGEEPTILKRLGKYTRGGGCLVIKKLSDVDRAILAKLISEAFILMKKKHS